MSYWPCPECQEPSETNLMSVKWIKMRNDYVPITQGNLQKRYDAGEEVW